MVLADQGAEKVVGGLSLMKLIDADHSLKFETFRGLAEIERSQGRFIEA